MINPLRFVIRWPSSIQDTYVGHSRSWESDRLSQRSPSSSAKRDYCTSNFSSRLYPSLLMARLARVSALYSYAIDEFHHVPNMPHPRKGNERYCREKVPIFVAEETSAFRWRALTIQTA